MAAHDDQTKNHPVVSHEEWLEARCPLLEQEKVFTRQCDEMSHLQRSLPWERVTKDQDGAVFHTYSCYDRATTS